MNAEGHDGSSGAARRVRGPTLLALALIAAASAVWLTGGAETSRAPRPTRGPRPDLLTDRVHDLVSLIASAEASPTSPYATQRFGLIHEADNRDGVACLRVPTGTSLGFHQLHTDGQAVLEFGAGVAWPEHPAGPDPVRFRIEARRAQDQQPAAWVEVFNEILDPALLPEGRLAVDRSVELPGTDAATWSLRFTTRRAGGQGLALNWPGFLSPKLRSPGRLRTPEEHQVAVATVSQDLVASLSEAQVLQQSETHPVELAFLDAAKGFSAAGGRRTSIRAATPSRIAYELAPPAGATLEFSVGMDTQLGWKRPGDGMRFAVEIDGERVWSLTLEAPQVIAHRGWKAAEIDLGPWVGKAVRLELVTEALGTTDNDVGGWSNAALLRRDQVPRLLRQDAPTVLLVLVDTLRADRLGAYGHSGQISPNLDAMADQGLLYLNAQASSSWTWPSTASVLTGLPPNVHGVHDSDRSYLVDALETLPEVFGRAGYTTGGFTSNLLIGRADNFHQGFETFSHTPYASARALNDRVSSWLDDTEGLARFGYIHYFDPHTPYLPPPGWLLDPPEGVRPEEVLKPIAQAQYDSGSPLDPALVEEYRSLLLSQYDSELRYFDHAFGELLDSLESRGILENCLIAFTSDHGEEFYEHDFFSHGGHLYRETLGVPLWVTGYGQAALSPARIERPASNQDLYSALCELVGLPTPKQEVPMGSLSPEAAAHPVFGQTWHGHEPGVKEWVQKLSITSGPFKLIHTPSTKRTELYDRSSDPNEHEDLAQGGASATQLQSLLRTLRAWDRRTRAAEQGVRVSGDSDTLAMMRQLGYVSGAEDAQDPDGH